MNIYFDHLPAGIFFLRWCHIIFRGWSAPRSRPLDFTGLRWGQLPNCEICFRLLVDLVEKSHRLNVWLTLCLSMRRGLADDYPRILLFDGVNRCWGMVVFGQDVGLADAVWEEHLVDGVEAWLSDSSCASPDHFSHLLLPLLTLL